MQGSTPSLTRSSIHTQDKWKRHVSICPETTSIPVYRPKHTFDKLVSNKIQSLRPAQTYSLLLPLEWSQVTHIPTSINIGGAYKP